jgi:nitrilase
MRGGSCIMSPNDELLAGPDCDTRTILDLDLDLDIDLDLDLDLDLIVRGKYDLDVAGHYARPDIFSFEADERPRRSVIAKTAD